ncbi:expressed protein [Aureococcus anophagefferens]|uniref:Expressed protein n=1 Tax=Aureococcus anophagefferens TaxID=44056 RepID=F0YAV0_AURAN|nr:expressed protein [Aureococcus anophagefferens]EGB07750.1 expressed protein [Aureococcus anophagefferens]|eukprot:XP_009037735.1 expressed protein [Aureococcus anophagefferens]
MRAHGRMGDDAHHGRPSDHRRRPEREYRRVLQEGRGEAGHEPEDQGLRRRPGAGRLQRRQRQGLPVPDEPRLHPALAEPLLRRRRGLGRRGLHRRGVALRPPRLHAAVPLRRGLLGRDGHPRHRRPARRGPDLHRLHRRRDPRDRRPQGRVPEHQRRRVLPRPRAPGPLHARRGRPPRRRRRGHHALRLRQGRLRGAALDLVGGRGPPPPPGRFPLVSTGFWTSDQLSERYRSGERARGVPT